MVTSNLTSVSVLVFLLGFIAARYKTDIRIPDPVYQIISVYLLFGIGLKGGVSLTHASVSGILKPIIATLVLGCLIPALAYLILKLIRNINQVDRGAIAAHYGSTSLVTFTAALVYLDNSKIAYEGFATALLTIMEIPGIIVGIFLATRHLNKDLPWSESLKEILLGKTIILLVGGLIVGAISGDAGYAKVEPFFVNLLPGIQVIKESGAKLFGFALLFPLFAGALGVIGGDLAGLSVGGATILGVLSASASYIAAPAAVGIALPDANPSLSITASLGVTFPMNLTLGIPAYYWLATLIVN
jgi:hypothetical protein